MSNFEWVKFRNKVPTAFKKRCRGFDLEIPVERGYSKARKKVLIVIGKVTTKDLTDGRLLGKLSDGLPVMERLLLEARKWGSNFGDVEAFKTAFINFNFFKNYHLSDDAYASSLQAKHKRIKRYVKKMKPDVIIVFGDEAMSVLQPSQKNSQFMRGCVFDADLRKGAKITSTLEWDSLMPTDKDTGRAMIDKANLMGFVFRNVSHALLGKNPLSLHSVKPKPVLIKTIKQYKRMMRKMRASKAIAVDTETGGLTVHNNRIATIQFANSSKKGYVVILDHQDTPFTAKEIRFIKKDLREFFSEEHTYKGKDTRYLIIHNAKFDLQVIRTVLNLPIILWPAWCTLAGEFCLDENVNGLIGSKTPAFNLAHMFARYGNDFYYRSEFSKSDRHLLADNPITKKELDYCAMDVQSIWAIHRAQLSTASAMKFQDKSYLEAYHRLVLVQMNNNIHGMYSMYIRGNPLDLKYQMYIASKRSPLNDLINAELDKLKSLPAAIKANEKLVNSSGAPKKGLFGKVKTPWVLSLDVVKHKEVLYFDTLKLEPLKRNAETGRGSMDKWFQAKYKDVPEIKILSRKNKLGVLRDTFAIGLLNRMSEDPDARVDNRVRPSYGFSDVVSGRSNSYKPSLQQIPERSAEAKIIKRSFIAEDGKIHIKMDYSSHEVRGWGFISNDSQVAASFIQINKLIAEFRRKGQKEVPSDKDRARLKAEGDIHRINYSAFSGVPVLKVTDEQRQSAKEIVFGSIYGMSAASLADKLGIEVEEAEELIEKFFSRAKKAKRWLDFTAEHARKHYYAFSPLGRRRNLYANITENRRIQGGCNRRAQNAPIQGMSSDFGFNAARLMEIAIFKTFRDLGRPVDQAILSAGVMQMVHDSIKLEMDYRDFFIILWIVEYCAVYGLRAFVEKTFDFKLNVDFAIEVEIGTIGDRFQKWDWTKKSLKDCIRNALLTQKEVLGSSLNVKKTIKMMYKEGRKHVEYLRKKYPLPIEPI